MCGLEINKQLQCTLNTLLMSSYYRLMITYTTLCDFISRIASLTFQFSSQNELEIAMFGETQPNNFQRYVS